MRKTERQRMLIRVLSKTGGSKRIYLFWGKARKFRRRERQKEMMKLRGIQTL